MLSAQQQNEMLGVLEHARRTAPLVHSTIHGEHHLAVHGTHRSHTWPAPADRRLLGC